MVICKVDQGIWICSEVCDSITNGKTLQNNTQNDKKLHVNVIMIANTEISLKNYQTCLLKYIKHLWDSKMLILSII